MLPLIAAALGSLGGVANGVYGLITGINENKEAREWMRHANDPEFIKSQIPQAIRDMLGLSENQLNGQMPGYGQAQQNIFTNQANTISQAQQAARGSSGFLATLGATQGATNNALQNLQLADAQDYQRRFGNLSNSANVYGNYYYNNYLNDLNRAFALKGAGHQTIGNAINALGGVAGFLGGNLSQSSKDNTPFIADYLQGYGSGPVNQPLINQIPTSVNIPH